MNNILYFWKQNLSNLPLLFVAAIGCLGTVYIFSTNLENDLSQEKELSWNERPFYNEELTETYLSVFGVKESGRTLEFVVHDYNKRAVYEVDFGDGVCVELTKSRVSHIYREEGEYVVSLQMFYQNEMINLINFPVIILSPSV